jgi:transposase
MVEAAPVLPARDAAASDVARQRRRQRGIIDIELTGRKRIRVDGDVDEQALRRVLDALGAR